MSDIDQYSYYLASTDEPPVQMNIGIIYVGKIGENESPALKGSQYNPEIVEERIKPQYKQTLLMIPKIHSLTLKKLLNLLTQLQYMAIQYEVVWGHGMV